MSNPQDALNSVIDRIKRACDRAGRQPAEITIVGVTKGHPSEIRRKARALGLRHLGENRVQEAVDKYGDEDFKSDSNRPQLHLIGHLQSNKAKKAIRLFDSIDTVDNLELALTLNRLAADSQKRPRVLIQVNTSGEYQKSGIAPQHALELAETVKSLNNLDFRGFMAVGPLEGDEAAIRTSFQKLRDIRDLASKTFLICLNLQSSPWA